MNKVFPVIVTYKGHRWYERCFNSLRHSTIPVKTIVVDNASNELQKMMTVCSDVVFGNKKKSLLFKFVMVYVVCWICNSFGIGLLERLHINNYLAGAITAIPVGFLGYVLNSIFVFKKQPKFLNLKKKQNPEDSKQEGSEQ